MARANAIAPRRLRARINFQTMLRPLLRPLIALALAASTLGAQTSRPDPLHQSGENVTISLLTMGTGKQVWEMFGHNAILIHDNVTGADTVFNWGVFNFKQPNFIPRFLQGRMLYAMGGDSIQWIHLVYRYLNRYVNVYLNDEDVRVLDGLGTAVKEGDTLVILPAMAGGR